MLRPMVDTTITTHEPLTKGLAIADPGQKYYRLTQGGCYSTDPRCRGLDCLNCPFDHCLEDDHPDREYQQAVKRGRYERHLLD